MNDPELLYELNKMRIDLRYSKEYIVGSRVLLYLDLLKHIELKKLIKRINKDRKTLKRREANSLNVENILAIDFKKSYKGNRMVVYTSIYGEYDKLNEPLYVDPNCDYYILTNQDVPENSIWKKKEFVFPPEVDTDFLKNRYVKMFPHKVFKDYQYSLYVDGNITIVSAISLYLKEFDCPTGIGMHKHPASNDLYDEIDACLMTNKIEKKDAEMLKLKLINAGFPKDYGMFECNIILRDHFNKTCKNIMESWWTELFCGAKRDQLHFTYSLFKNGYKYGDVVLLGENMNRNPMFIRESHN